MTLQRNRRLLLKSGGLAALASVMPTSCTGSSPTTTPVTSLPKVDIAENRIIRKVAGLRPFRRSGFVVRADSLCDKTVVHNYGHGGCGVTLSWGTANMALKLSLDTPHRDAAVIGCGVIGLTTARMLQDHGFTVTIYTAALPPETTSNVAAGVFGVTEIADTDQLTGPFKQQLQEAVRFAHCYFQPFVGQSYGVRWVTFYMIGDEPQTQPPDFAVTPELYPLTTYRPGEHPFPTKYAASFPTMIAETNVFLPRLVEEFVARGGEIVVRSFAIREELCELAEPLLLNCTGLGAKTLFDDKELKPIKGQLTVLRPQADIDYCYLDGAKFLYMCPRSDGIVLGGSREEAVWTTKPNLAAATRIFDGHQEIIDGMR
ncbi:FAD-binding oxidoreductase [Streptomyces sp. NBC_01619]|uniref:FAD-dependent oxidoreductase n=1 Tax=Streptomyces sp. NBC_01619 TaxID=2975901 RepID=UPI00224C7FAE|nr:FAD-dependent oxidoreductase [Streptomyces sp. NBC_01619]MCX4515952.1 FAD-binding oxidoreductase [Streptomyces sp. NBC_01619]